jgi:hypothetical protein
MEDRSSRRLRALVTRMARRGLTANEIARALISMMALSTTSSNQRPDTLMQDRYRQLDENLLRRTAGPYIRVKLSHAHAPEAWPLYPQLRKYLDGAGTAVECHIRTKLGAIHTSYLLITDDADCGVVIGSACLWTSFHVPLSWRNKLVTRRASGTSSSPPPTFAIPRSTSTTQARSPEAYVATSSTLVTFPSR